MSFELKKSSARTALWSLLVLTLVAVRFPGIIDRGPWLDERVSLNEAVGSFYRSPMPEATFTPADFWAENTLGNVVVATQSGEGGLGLPYHLLLHFWIGWFGPGELSVRGLSLILGLAVVGVTFLLARKLLGALGGAISAVFCGFHPVAIQMSQEIRSYALAMLFCLLGALFLVHLIGERSNPRAGCWQTIAFGGCMALGFVAHYAAASAVLGILMFGAWTAVRHSEPRRLLLSGFVVFCGCMLFWLLTVGLDGLRHFATESAGRRAALASGDPNWAWVHAPTARYLVAGSVGALLTLLGCTLQSTFRVFLLAPFLGLLAYYAAQGSRSRDSGIRRTVLLGLCVIGSGVGVAVINALVNGHDSGLNGRYFAFHVPFAAVLFAGAILHAARAPVSRKPLGAALALHALLIAASLPAVYRQFTQERRPNIYAEIARILRTQQDEARLVTFPSWVDARTVCLYEGPDVRIPHRVLDRPSDDVILYAASGRELRRLWINRAHAR